MIALQTQPGAAYTISNQQTREKHLLTQAFPLVYCLRHHGKESLKVPQGEQAPKIKKINK